MADDFASGIKSVVVTWLADEEWEVSDASAENAEWCVSAQAGRSSVIVGQAKGKPYQLFFQTTILLRHEVEQSQSAVDAIREIRMGLAGQRLESDIGVSPFRVDMYRKVFLDASGELTRDTFWERFDDVRRGVLVVREVMERRGLVAPQQ